MKELVTTIVILIFITIFNIVVPIENKILEAFIALIPAVYPTYQLWKKDIRKSVRWISFSRKDTEINYSYSFISEEFNSNNFQKLKDAVLAIENARGKDIRYFDKGEIWVFECKIFKSDSVKMNFKSREGEFFLEYSIGKSYKYAIKYIEKLLRVVENETTNVRYQESNNLLEIEFIDIEGEQITNPFIKKFFENFKDMKINLKYKGESNSDIEIFETGIRLKNSHISNLAKDFNSEFKIKLRNFFEARF